MHTQDKQLQRGISVIQTSYKTELTKFYSQTTYILISDMSHYSRIMSNIRSADKARPHARHTTENTWPRAKASTTVLYAKHIEVGEWGVTCFPAFVAGVLVSAGPVSILCKVAPQLLHLLPSLASGLCRWRVRSCCRCKLARASTGSVRLTSNKSRGERRLGLT
jgi:hypothetical protein